LTTLQPARLLLTFYGSDIQRLASRRLLRWSTTHLLPKAARISVISHFARDLFVRHFPQSAARIVLTPCALRTDLVPGRPAPPAPKPLQDRGATVARINPRKGQLQVIEALKALPAAQRAALEYWLVGSHSKENYDSVLAAAAASADFPVKFLGDIPDDKLDEIYQQADIFAMTSMPHKHSVEGFGLVYLEAGAHGLPVIAHDIGGVSDAVTQGETGLLVAPVTPPLDRGVLAAHRRPGAPPAIGYGRPAARGPAYVGRLCVILVWTTGLHPCILTPWSNRAPRLPSLRRTDMMGIVYHGSYLPWFEVGRTTLLKECGLPYRELETQGYHLPVIELGAKFFKPALYDDELTIITQLRERPLLRIRLDYEVRRGEEQLVTGSPSLLSSSRRRAGPAPAILHAKNARAVPRRAALRNRAGCEAAGAPATG